MHYLLMLNILEFLAGACKYLNSLIMWHCHLSWGIKDQLPALAYNEKMISYIICNLHDGKVSATYKWLQVYATDVHVEPNIGNHCT